MEKTLNLEYTYKTLDSRLYSDTVLPNLKNLSVIAFNNSLAEDLGLEDESIYEEVLQCDEKSQFIRPIAQAYGGHQYGYYRFLGDGRSMLLGEVLDKKNNRYDIHLKGSGTTMYSRGGDGKATLSSMLREYICSEAMYFLNVPTTRSLSVFTTGESVIREKIQMGAILFRVGKSHIRVGTFQLASQLGKVPFENICDYTIERHYPHLKNSKDKYEKLYEAIVFNQAKLIAKWMSLGFVHGVMNTDNMLLSGETIDYGPLAFINQYDKDAVFSSIDKYGRYAFGNQPDIAKWNLAKLGETFLVLGEDDSHFIENLDSILNNFHDLYSQFYFEEMAMKLGVQYSEHRDIIEEFLNILETSKADYTNVFLGLINHLEEEVLEIANITSFFKNKKFTNWYEKWTESLLKNRTKKESITYLKSVNPSIVLRNSLLESALDKASIGNMEDFNQLLEDIRQPFNYERHKENFHKIYKNENYITYCGT